MAEKRFSLPAITVAGVMVLGAVGAWSLVRPSVGPGGRRGQGQPLRVASGAPASPEASASMLADMPSTEIVDGVMVIRHSVDGVPGNLTYRSAGETPAAGGTDGPPAGEPSGQDPSGALPRDEAAAPH